MKIATLPAEQTPATKKSLANTDLKVLLGAIIALVVIFHLGNALRGQGHFRDIHLGTALHYAQTKFDLADTIIVGFNATDTPTIQEFPLWQMAAGLAFKMLGPWWGWANLVSLALFLPCLYPLFQIARLHLDDRNAWWTLIFFLTVPLVFLFAGTASTDGFSLAVTIWFLYCGLKLVGEPGFKWLLPACALGSLAAVSKLPFFMAAGLALFFLALGERDAKFKRLGLLGIAGGVAGVLFLLWTHLTDTLQAGAVFPYVDLRLGHVTNGMSMTFWYFGDWHYRFTAGNWLKAGWRILTGLFGDFVLVGLVGLALISKRSHPVARSLLAGGALTTLVFTHLVFQHWHYYLMFAPAIALLCAEGLGRLIARLAVSGPKPVVSGGIFVLLGLSLVQGLMAMRELTYDPYPSQMAELIRGHTAPTDKLVIIGGGWGGQELFASHRQGLSAWDTHLVDRPEDLARLKAMGYNKLVMLSESPFHNAIQVVNPGQAGLPRLLYQSQLTPQVAAWPTVLQTDDILIKEIP